MTTSDCPTSDALPLDEKAVEAAIAVWLDDPWWTKFALGLKAKRERGEAAIRAYLASAPASPAIGMQAVKALDLSHLIRDAFLSGRGLKDGDKLSEADQAAFMEYDPTEHVSYKRIYAALYPSLTPSGTAPSPISDGVREAVAGVMDHARAINSSFRDHDVHELIETRDELIRVLCRHWRDLYAGVASLEAALSQEHAPGRKESQ